LTSPIETLRFTYRNNATKRNEIQTWNPIMPAKTRTVALTPIAREVAAYVAWLRNQGHIILRVKESTMPGVDTLVTFIVND